MIAVSWKLKKYLENFHVVQWQEVLHCVPRQVDSENRATNGWVPDRCPLTPPGGSIPGVHYKCVTDAPEEVEALEVEPAQDQGGEDDSKHGEQEVHGAHQRHRLVEHAERQVIVLHARLT